MKFIDSIIIRLSAGNGGPGMVGFKAAKNQPKLGPDGGDGGFGGDVYFLGDSRLNTLSSLRYNQQYRAENGAKGGGNDRTGRNGEDQVIPVPLGTIAFNEENQAIVCEIVEAGQKTLVCKGGKRGLGNARFMSSINQAPTQNTKGGEGEQLTVRLELKLLADVGLAGFPNAGKSTLVSTMTRARPKIADYPFTTLVPHLGVVEMDALTGGFGQSFVIADIPGLIEGAHQGKGLGHEFLKHLERTQIIVFLLDGAGIFESEESLVDQYRKLSFELKAFSQMLALKEGMIVVSKADLFASDPEPLEAAIRHLKAEVPDLPCFSISSAIDLGISELKMNLFKRLDALKQEALTPPPPLLPIHALTPSNDRFAAENEELPLIEDPELIIFGGTFDPPHSGHIDCIRAALSRFRSARLVVVPGFCPPLIHANPDLNVKTPILNFEERVSLVSEVLRREFEGARIEISSLEKDLPTPSYTYQTLHAFAERYPGKRLALLVGDDQLAEFHRWKNPAAILRCASLLVVRRRHRGLEERSRTRDGAFDARQAIQELTSRLNLRAITQAATGKTFILPEAGDGGSADRHATMIDVIDVETIPAESSLIRAMIKDGHRLPGDWLPSYLVDMIDHNQFYR